MLSRGRRTGWRCAGDSRLGPGNRKSNGKLGAYPVSDAHRDGDFSRTVMSFPTKALSNAGPEITSLRRTTAKSLTSAADIVELFRTRIVPRKTTSDSVASSWTDRWEESPDARARINPTTTGERKNGGCASPKLQAIQTSFRLVRGADPLALSTAYTPCRSAEAPVSSGIFREFRTCRGCTPKSRLCNHSLDSKPRGY
jgi:hypothetical protein